MTVSLSLTTIYTHWQFLLCLSALNGDQNGTLSIPFLSENRANWHSGESHIAGRFLWHTRITEPLSVMMSMNFFLVYITIYWGKNIHRFSMINRKSHQTLLPHTQKHTWQKQISTVYKRSLSNCKKKCLLPYKWITAFLYFMPLRTAWLGKTILLITCFVFLENKFWC